MEQQVAETVVDELRMLIRDVRVLLDAMPVEPELVGTRFVPHAAMPADDDRQPGAPDVDAAAFSAKAEAVAAAAAHAAHAVRARGDEIDAILAEIRRVRAGAAAA